MSSKIFVPLMQVTIRRDANTITPTTVPPYEVTLLRQMFNKENVTVGDQVSVIEVDASLEHERLCAKYGQSKVMKVYGDDSGERLAELVEKHCVRAEAAKAKVDKTAKV